VDVLPLLERAYSEAIDVAAKLRPEDLDRPTPSSGPGWASSRRSIPAPTPRPATAWWPSSAGSR